MSWSVAAHGKPAEVQAQLAEQFKGPLAVPPAGLSDAGERETVKRVAEMVAQCLGTFDPEKKVAVNAYGHMGFADWDAESGAYQEVNVTIQPGF